MHPLMPPAMVVVNVACFKICKRTFEQSEINHYHLRKMEVIWSKYEPKVFKSIVSYSPCMRHEAEGLEVQSFSSEVEE